MSRPRKTGLDYFPHDVQLSNDEKMEKLEARFGLEGYAVYLKLLERIYKNGGKLFISDEETMIILSKKLGLDTLKLTEIINGTCFFELFNKRLWEDAKCLTSPGILNRIKVIDKKRVKSRKVYKKEFPTSETQQKVAETPESKVKESKVKERKVNIRCFVPPTYLEVKDYCVERKNTVNAHKFIAHYSANGWKQKGGNPIKDWKSAVITWEENSFDKNGPKKVDNTPRKPPDINCPDCRGDPQGIFAQGTSTYVPCYCTKRG